MRLKKAFACHAEVQASLPAEEEQDHIEEAKRSEKNSGCGITPEKQEKSTSKLY